MELNELQIGKWYAPNGNTNWFYSPLKWNEESIYESLLFNDRGQLSVGKSGYISNKDFWRNCKMIEVEDLPETFYKKLPEEYKKPKQFIPQIFN